MLRPDKDDSNPYRDICKQCIKDVGYCQTYDYYECLSESILMYNQIKNTIKHYEDL